MAMVSSRGYGGGSYSYYGGGSYSYTVTETYTLEEAINKASTGSLSPGEVYRKMPKQIQGEVDSIARRLCSKTFSSLSYSEQCHVMSALAAKVKRTKEEAEKPVSLFDALRLAAEGKIDDLKLYDALPNELRSPMDALAQSLTSSDFKPAKSEVRSRVLKIILGALVEQATNKAAEVGLELHNRALELKKKGSAVEALKMMRDSETALDQLVNSNPSTPAVVHGYCNLSSARAHIGDWTSDTSALRSAITAADRGLEKLGNPAWLEAWRLSQRGSTLRMCIGVFAKALTRMLQGFRHLRRKTSAVQDLNRGVLLHNRAHARWRLGEITHKRAALVRGRKDVAEAAQVFKALKHVDAVKENNELSSRIENAITRL